MMQKLKVAGEYVATAFYITLFLAVGLMFLRLLGDMWPVFTVMFFLFVTAAGLEKGNWVMSLGGLALYIASWPAMDIYGTLIGLTVWFVGFMVWFLAPMITLPQTKLCTIKRRA